MRDLRARAPNLSVRGAVLAVVLGVVLISYVLMSAGVQWTYPAADAEAYWLAAINLRQGSDIYAGCPDCADTYRYAPWFAYSWVPLTYLPKAVVMPAWVGAMLLATAACLYPLARGWRPEGLVVGVLIGTQLFHNAWMGNVHSLMLLPLVYAPNRRLGPLWIALAASLKFVPIALAMVYVVRRDWQRAAWAGGLSILLTAPMLLFDLSRYSSELGRTYSLWPSDPVIAALLVLAALIGLWRWRSTPLAWLMAGALVMAISPRLHLSGMGYLLAGSSETEAGQDRRF